jgi:VWFA-related protein
VWFSQEGLLGDRFSLSRLVFPADSCRTGISQPPAPSEQSASNARSSVIKTESRIVLVDAVVTEKKGNYLHDLTQQDFRVYEDNKEQKIVSLSSGSEALTEPHRGPKHYIVLFFDNSSMEQLDQMQARKAAAKFIEQNAGDDRLMTVAEFGGSLRIKQDFTANAELLMSAISGSRTPHMKTNLPGPSISDGLPMLAASGSDFGVRSLFLSIRSIAKNLRSMPSRKILILFSAGFPLLTDPEHLPELSATIDACNKSNVTIYSVDV